MKKKHCPRCDQDITDSYNEVEFEGQYVAHWYCDGCQVAVLDRGDKDGGSEEYECRTGG